VSRWRSRGGSVPILVAVLVAMQGCAPSRTTVKRERTLSAAEVLTHVRERNDMVKTLSGDGSITIESPEGSNNGSFDAMLKKPDSLCVDLRGPLGIRVGSLFLSPERFIFYNRFENTAMIGKPDGKTLRSMFRLTMQFDEVIGAFTGEFPTVSKSDSLESFSVNDEGFYVLKYRTHDGRKEYWIDGDAFIVAGYRVFDGEGSVMVNASAGGVEEDDKIPMPRFLRVIFPHEQRSVTIAYDDVVVNKPFECAFVIPEQAQILQR